MKPPDRARLAIARPDIGDREVELVTQVLRSDVLAMGSFTTRFESGLNVKLHRSPPETSAPLSLSVTPGLATVA